MDTTKDMVTIPLTITIKDPSGAVRTTAKLVVTIGKGVSATLTPSDGGTIENCSNVTWNPAANGQVGFTFRVSGGPDGKFPLGNGGTPENYVFTGTVPANGGFPSGTVNWPSQDPLHPDIEETDTWQAGATTGEPLASSQGA